MSLDNKPIYTGGCQCGAIRFRVEGALHHASICHCRMCQKAFGSFYAPLATVNPAKVALTPLARSRVATSTAPRAPRALTMSLTRLAAVRRVRESPEPPLSSGVPGNTGRRPRG